MKRENWMSDAGYMSGVLETQRDITAKRNPRNWKRKLLFAGAMLAMGALLTVAYVATLHSGVAAAIRLTEGAPAFANAASNARGQ
jgi:hypothetical protein